MEKSWRALSKATIFVMRSVCALYVLEKTGLKNRPRERVILITVYGNYLFFAGSFSFDRVIAEWSCNTIAEFVHTQAKKTAKDAQKERRKTKIKKHIKQQRIKHTSGSKKK